MNQTYVYLEDESNLCLFSCFALSFPWVLKGGIYNKRLDSQGKGACEISEIPT